MSHFSKLRFGIQNLEVLKQVLEQDLELKPDYQKNRIFIGGHQFGCRTSLSFKLVKNANGADEWQMEGDFWYISRTRLGGETQSAEINITALYTKRIIEQQLALNGIGWEVGEMRLSEDGRTTVITARGMNGETIDTNVNYGQITVGVQNVQGRHCIDLTSHLTNNFTLQEQTQTDEFAMMEVNYDYLIQ